MVDIRREVNETRFGLARSLGRVFLKAVLSIWVIGGGFILGGEAASHLAEPSDVVILFCLSAAVAVAFAVGALLWLIWKGEVECFLVWFESH